MVNHIVLWNFLAELTEQERKTAGETIKLNLEGVQDKIDGVISIEVIVEKLDSSTHDIALISKFASEEALNGYQQHPEHLKAASFVRSVTCNRACFDY